MEEDVKERVTKHEFQRLSNYVDDGTFKAEDALEQFEEMDFKMDEIRDSI